MAESDVPEPFRGAVAELLYHAQAIEWMLRELLSEENEILALRRKRKARVKDFGRHTLGMLVDLYAKHSHDDDLVKRLRTFTEHRNKAAHELFVAGWVHRENPDKLARGLALVNKHAAEGQALMDLVTVESARAYLVRRSLEGNAMPESFQQLTDRLERDLIASETTVVFSEPMNVSGGLVVRAVRTMPDGTKRELEASIRDADPKSPEVRRLMLVAILEDVYAARLAEVKRYFGIE